MVEMRPMLGEQVWDGPTQRATHEIVTLYVGNKMILEHVVRLGICRKIYTTQFSGERILHTENT